MKLMSVAMAALLMSSAALAQPGPMMGGDDMPMMGMMGGHCAMMGRTEGALAFLKTELKITAAQEKSWDAFADAYRANAADMPMGHGPRGGHGKMKGKGAHMMGGMGGGPFPDVMAQHLQMMEQHIDGARKMTDAATPLYKALNADQRKTADELLPRFVMMRCGMRGAAQ